MSGSSYQTRKEHWEKVYQKKATEQLTWFQRKPVLIPEWIRELDLPKDARIIDVGGGDSLLVDHLLEEGFTEVSVLDICTMALDRAAERLGADARRVHWFAEDILTFNPPFRYRLWHDRATFHFLREKEDIRRYVDLVTRAVVPGGYLIIGTFSDQGPMKCSGLEVNRYSAEALQCLFDEHFEPVKWAAIDHVTPDEGRQNFLYGMFRREE